MHFYRPTWAEINLTNLAHNYVLIKKMVSKKVRIMACVKADAYGHGIIPVSKRLESLNIDYLSVASVDEAINLRKSGIKTPVLVLGAILKSDIGPLLKYNITPTLCDREIASAISAFCCRAKKKKKVHVKIDTGMGRIGVLYEDAFSFVKYICGLKNISIEGVFTHLPCADSNPEFTFYQLDIFEQLIEGLRQAKINIPMVHAANSLGILRYRQSHFNTIRPGLILYGLSSSDKPLKGFRPVLSLKTRAVFIKKVPKGWGISYGHTYITNRDTTVVTLPIGYGDGYPRNLSNLAPVIIRGRLLKVNGTVCMDQMMVDAGVLKVRKGDEVILIGSQGKSRITAEHLAKLAGTIPYEIVCGLGSRIPRVYLK